MFQSAQVQIAGGGSLHSPGSLQSVPWSVEHCNFCSNFRVLDLSAFDAIVGMDWLQAFSPIQIHWEHKWLAIPYNGSWTVLQGLDAVGPDSVYLQLFSVDNLGQQVRLLSHCHHKFNTWWIHLPHFLRRPLPCLHPGAATTLFL